MGEWRFRSTHPLTSALDESVVAAAAVVVVIVVVVVVVVVTTSLSQWARGLRHVLSSTARTLGSWVRILLEA
jgi:hypothetical protein